MKRIASIIISLTMILSMIPVAFADNQNVDNKTYWYTPYLEYLINHGFTFTRAFGYEGEDFEPNGDVTAEDLMTNLLRIHSLEIPEEYQSGGAGQDGLRLESLYLCTMYGIFDEDEYTFDTWYEPITRSEMAYMIRQYMSVFEKESVAINSNLNMTNILSDFSSYTIDEQSDIGFLVSYGIVAGSSDGKFHGERILNEAELVTILYRLLNESERIKMDIPDFSKQLSTFTTTTTKDTNRNFNINRAAESINDTVIEPGEEFSFYKTIGNPGKKEGYKESTVISGGKYVKGYGGGVCQDATTLFNAALLSNMTITQRKAHGLRPSYVKPGYDATFASGYIDFRFVNPYDKPIKIKANFDYDTLSLTVSIYGAESIEIPEVNLYTTGSGHSYTLYREVNGEVNYKTSSTYKD